MQSPEADLSPYAPTVSFVNPLSCMITAWSSKCNTDTCYQAGGRCVPNDANTKCIPRVYTSLPKRDVSWADHPEIAQECQYCSCIRQSHRGAFELEREMVDKSDGHPTNTEEAAPTESQASATEEQAQDIELCELLAKRGKSCNEAECHREGGRCSMKPNSGGLICSAHILIHGTLLPRNFESNYQLPSCTGCRCLRKGRNSSYSPRAMLERQKLIPHPKECEMTDRKDRFCNYDDCEREGGRCTAKPHSGSSICYSHILINGELRTHAFGESPLLPSCRGCRCLSADDPVLSRNKRKLAEMMKYSDEPASSSELDLGSIPIYRKKRGLEV
jgi:hypothetical protein